MTLNDIKNIVVKNYKKCWNKMGSTGADDYDEIATEEEKLYFHQFLVWERMFHYLDLKAEDLKIGSKL